MASVPDTPRLTKAQAKRLTERIQSAAENLWTLLLDAHDQRAWEVLGYGSWGEYVDGELGMSRSRSFQLLDQAKTIRELTSVAGVSTDVDISEAVARDIKPVLPAVVDRVKAAVKHQPRAKRPAIVAQVVKEVREEVRSESLPPERPSAMRPSDISAELVRLLKAPMGKVWAATAPGDARNRLHSALLKASQQTTELWRADQAGGASVKANGCEHPKKSEDIKPYGVFCLVCGVKLR